MIKRILGIVLLVLIWDHSAFAQATGTLLPVPQQVFFDASGQPLDSGLVYTYTAGTTTPLTTFSDMALTVANPNPIVLNSAGRNPAGGIYVTATTLKVIVKTSTGSTVYTQDNIPAVPGTTVASSFNSTCDIRLTLTSATPVTTSDVTAATTVYATPTRGNRCALYDGSSQWNISSFTELSIALGTDTANTNYDVFLYLSSGTPTIERVAWTNDTTRATAITLQDGVYVKSGSTTRRYIGTYRTTAVAGQTEDSAAKRFLWNYYNRVQRAIRVLESTDSWTYTTATYRQGNNAVTNQVAVVVGVAAVRLSLRLSVMAANTNAGVGTTVSIGEDSATTPASGVLMSLVDAPVANLRYALVAVLDRAPAIGYHYYTWMEYSLAVGTTTWYGDAGAPTLVQSGLTGTIEG
jgi:hypothetical protein